MVDPLRPATSIEREACADRCPQPPILLRPQSDLPDRVIRRRHIFDVHHTLPTRQRGPQGARRQVPPGRRVQIDALLARTERDEAGIGIDRREVTRRDQRPPVEALGVDRQDEIGMNAVVGDVDRRAVRSLAPPAVDGNERADQRCDRRLERLTPEENALYEDLRADRLGAAVRLEQERIAFGWLTRALSAL